MLDYTLYQQLLDAASKQPRCRTIPRALTEYGGYRCDRTVIAQAEVQDYLEHIGLDWSVKYLRFLKVYRASVSLGGTNAFPDGSDQVEGDGDCAAHALIQAALYADAKMTAA